MSIEELKMVLETIQQLSGDASTAAIVWMAMHYGEKVLFVSIIMGGIVAGIRTIGAAVSNTNDWAALGRKVAQALGGHGSAYSYAEDERKIMAALHEAAMAKAAQKEAEK